MANLIQHQSLSDAWAAALEHLVNQHGGKDINLAVAYGAEPERPAIRAALDALLADQRARALADPGRQQPAGWSVNTVANTLFPLALHDGGVGAHSRARFYEAHARAQGVHRRLRRSENYFNRIVAYPSPNGPFNQLEHLITRLEAQLGKPGGALSSAYELGADLPGGEDNELPGLRVFAPSRDKQLRGFPCLSHVSLTLAGGALHLTAVYRNQYFISRGYGNYIGLLRIARFIAEQTGITVGEVMCIASHADADYGFGTARVRALATVSAAAADAYSSEAKREVAHV